MPTGGIPRRLRDGHDLARAHARRTRQFSQDLLEQLPDLLWAYLYMAYRYVEQLVARRDELTVRRVVAATQSRCLAVAMALTIIGGLFTTGTTAFTQPAPGQGTATTGPQASELAQRQADQRASRNEARGGAAAPGEPTSQPRKPKRTPPWVAPVETYKLTSGYGARWGTEHNGIDLAAATGTPVDTVRGGTVVLAGWHRGYGNSVVVDHGNGVRTLYGHNSALHVKQGQRVKTGQRIASMGSTGQSTGPHLHLEVLVGNQAVDPAPWLEKRGVKL